jgi:hypothetical protein
MVNRKPIKQGGQIDDRKKIKSQPVDYSSLSPVWRFGRFDSESVWGMNAIHGNYQFVVSDDLLNELAKFNDDEVFNAIDSLNGRKFPNVDKFIAELKNKCNNCIPLNLLHAAVSSLKIQNSFDTILPQLKDYERMTWETIERTQHGKSGKSKNHYVSVENLAPNAQKRLNALGLVEDELYSLRLGGTIRLYGLREENIMYILWIDYNHEVYPLKSD